MSFATTGPAIATCAARNVIDASGWVGIAGNSRCHGSRSSACPRPTSGGELCWRGEVMWEGEGQHFAPLAGDNCRTITGADVGKRIVGVGIKPDTLAMHLTPPWSVRLQNFARGILLLAAVVALMGVLVRVRTGRMLVPLIIVGLSVLVIAVDDASFLGGLRPFDGGDDGLFYDGVGRVILQKLLAGDFFGALEGGEKVFYYGGPGLRYFRALEHIVFGESYLGYLSLVLLFPFLAFALFRRFLPERWSLALIFRFRRHSDRHSVWHQLRAIRTMGIPRLCRPGRIHPVRRRYRVDRTFAVRRESKFPSRVFWRAAVGAWNLHETDCGAGRGRSARRRGRRSTLLAAVGAACRPVRRVSPGIFHGGAQLGVWPCLCAVQRQCRARSRACDAAVSLCRGRARTRDIGVER